MITKKLAEREDLPDIEALLFYGNLVHRHLDWQDPQSWFGSRTYFVLKDNTKLLSLLVIPEEPKETEWVRLFVHSNKVNGSDCWQELWEYFENNHHKPENTAGAIVLNNSFQNMLTNVGFLKTQNIVVLEKSGLGRFPPRFQKPEIIIRDMRYDDLDAVADIDRRSFVPLWQNSKVSLQKGLAYQSIASVAIIDGEIGGYQLSSIGASHVHLARLAVVPEHQKRGVGSALLENLELNAIRNNIVTISVNTQ